MHSTKYGRASLATDMMEEFRSPVVDRLVIYLVNKGAIKPSQFTPKGQKNVKMDDRARKSYLANYEKFMTTTFLDVKTKKQKNYRQIIKEKVLEMERALLNNTDYTPYVFYS